MMPATVQRVAFGVRAHTPALRVNKHRDQAVVPCLITHCRCWKIHPEMQLMLLIIFDQCRKQ